MRTAANPSLRPATPQDAPEASALLRLSMGTFAAFYFGGHPRLSVDEILAALFATEGHRFSHEWSVLCEMEGGAAGLLVAFPGRLVGRLSAGLARQLLELIGPLQLARLAMRLIDYSGVREAAASEYYVAQLAVAPGFRRRGIGRRLMEHADAEGRKLGLPHCSLYVDSENTAAFELYTGLGYHPAGEFRSRYPGFEIPRRIYLRMRKDLTVSAGSAGSGNAQVR